EDEGAEIAHRIWANSGLPGELSQVLPSPRHFEQASQLVTVESTRGSVACGKDPKAHVEAFRPYADAGFDEVYVANIGPHYGQMLEFYRDEILPAIRQNCPNPCQSRLSSGAGTAAGQR